MNERTTNAYRAALQLIGSSTSGWTWEKAVEQVATAFQLNAEEVEEVRTAKFETRKVSAESTLTENETAVLRAFLDDDYSCGDLSAPTYSFSILDACPSISRRGGGGVFSSLQKKGLISTYDDEGNDLVVLTDAGRVALASL